MANIIAIAPQEKIFQTTIDFYMLFDEQKKQLEEKLNTVNCADLPCFSGLPTVNMKDLSIQGVSLGDTKLGSYTTTAYVDNWCLYARSQSEIVAYEKTVQDPANNNFLTEKQNKEYLAMQGYIFWLSKLWAGDDQVLYNWSHA